LGTASFLTLEEDSIRRALDGLVGLVVQTFAVADAYPVEDVVWDAARAQLRARLVARTVQAQTRFDSGHQALVDALLVRARQRGPHDHLDELLVRLAG
jgi:hypothetical protein